MTKDESPVPVDVADRLLWRDAQMMLDRHAGSTGGRCDWCGWRWPCPPRRLAERAATASHRPYRSYRPDLSDLPELALRADRPERSERSDGGGPAPVQRGDRGLRRPNARRFD